MVSAVILTKNEERNIKACLEGLSWCKEIIVIDDYSKDKTVETARQFNAQIYYKHCNNDFASQRNFGLEKAKKEWVLFIDADERVTNKLAWEIQSRLGDTSIENISGFYLKRQDRVLGHTMRYGETGRIKLLRLARHNAGQWERAVHEIWRVKGPVAELREPLLHYPHENIAHYLKTINYYSSTHSQVLYKEGKRSSFWQILGFPIAKFFVNYIVYLGILDGMAGLIHAIFMSFHSFLARGKLWLSVENSHAKEKII